MFIGIHGPKRSGKDILANALFQFYYTLFSSYNTNSRSCMIDRFADPIRDVLCIMYNIPKEIMYTDDKENVFTTIRWNNLNANIQKLNVQDNEFLTVREVLQIFGTNLIRKHWDENVWARLPIIKHDGYKGSCIMSDVRFFNEANFLKKNYGVLIKLNRDTGLVDSHESEHQEIPIEWFDFIIDVEDGVDNYKKQIDDFIEQNKRKLFPNVCFDDECL